MSIVITASKLQKLRDLLSKEVTSDDDRCDELIERVLQCIGHNAERYQKYKQNRRISLAKVREERKVTNGTTYTNAHKQYYQRRKVAAFDATNKIMEGCT
jgi:hypothetical protein